MISLPEERALAGKAEGLGIDPLSLSPDDEQLLRYRDQAIKVLERGAKFGNADLHQVVARLLLGV